MKNDLTLLYYSSNAMDEDMADNFRNHLVETVQGAYPIISVTQKPVSLGENICLGDIGQSSYNLYRQQYAGAQQVKTKYVAFAEDDCLYNMEHFSHRPSSDNVFSYNKNLWFLDKNIFWTKEHLGGFTTVVCNELLLDRLSEVFEKYPVEPLPRKDQKGFFLEPGTRDEELGLKKREIEFFSTEQPLITLCYWDATHGWPKRREKNSTVVEELENWGRADELRKKLCQKSV